MSPVLQNDILNQRIDITKGYFLVYHMYLYLKRAISILVHPWRTLSRPPYSILKGIPPHIGFIDLKTISPQGQHTGFGYIILLVFYHW